ncbi:MAG: hypothetical protein SangKO_026170 [Sandaracinaceae bacterium]
MATIINETERQTLPCTVKDCPCGNLDRVVIVTMNGKPTPLHQHSV